MVSGLPELFSRVTLIETIIQVISELTVHYSKFKDMVSSTEELINMLMKFWAATSLEWNLRFSLLKQKINQTLGQHIWILLADLFAWIKENILNLQEDWKPPAN